MVHEFKAGDWVVDKDGFRMFVIGRDTDGDIVVENGQFGDLENRDASDLTPLPGCTGWDWQPQAAQQYRLLNVGETIQDGDEIRENHNWYKLTPITFFAPVLKEHNPIRRVIPPAAPHAFESESDPVYVISTVERAAWDARIDGSDITTSEDCEELLPVGSVPGGRLFLLPK